LSNAILDSGATTNLFSDRKYFEPGTLVPCYKRITCADNLSLFAYLKGTVVLHRFKNSNSDRYKVTLPDSLLVTGIGNNLISTNKLTEGGYMVIMVDVYAMILSQQDHLGERKTIYKVQKAFESDKLYHIPFFTSSELQSIQSINSQQECKAFIATTPKVLDINTIHQRYNHCSEKVCKIIMNHRTNKTTKKGTVKSPLHFCNACALCMRNKAYKRKTVYNEHDTMTLTPQQDEHNDEHTSDKSNEPNNDSICSDTHTQQHDENKHDTNIHKQEKPNKSRNNNIYIDSHTQQEIKTDTNRIDDELGLLVQEAEVRTQSTKQTLPFTHMALDAKTFPFLSVRGYRFANILVCRTTGYSFCFLHKDRSELIDDYTFWSRYIYNMTGKFPATLRVDQARENINKKMKSFTTYCGTKLTSTTTKQSNQNPEAENKIGTIFHSMKKIHVHSGVPLEYGCYGMAYATLVSNHIPSRAIEYDKPVDRAGLISIDQMLRVYGCLVFYWKVMKTDADLTGRPAIFLGFANLQRGYYFLDIETRQVVTSRYGIFREQILPFRLANNGVLLPIVTYAWPNMMDVMAEQTMGGNTNDKTDNNTTKNENDDNLTSLPVQSPNNMILQQPELGLIQPQNIPQQPFNQAQVINIGDNSMTEVLDTSKILTDKLNSQNNTTPEPTSQFDPLSTIPKIQTTINTYTPTLTNIEGEEEKVKYEAEKLMKRRLVKQKGQRNKEKQYEYQVKWKDCDELTWEPQENLLECEDLLNEYAKRTNVKIDNIVTKELQFDNVQEEIVPNKEDITRLNQQAIDLDLLHEEHTNTLIHKPIETMLSNQQVRRSNRLKSQNRSEGYYDDDKIRIQPIDEGKETREEIVQVDKEVLEDTGEGTVRIPLFGSHLTTTNTDEIKIRPREIDQTTWKTFLAAEKAKAPPDYTQHDHYTKPDINLDEVISYALTTINNCIRENFGEDGSNEKPPKTREEMIKGERTTEFKQAEGRELTSIIHHKTMDIVIRPKDRKPITCRWVYDIKRDNDNNITLFKARLVVHGFKQVEGVDFVKTFSSTAQMRSFRVIIMLAIAYDMELTQYDISNAFLNGELDEEIFMEFPPGYPGENENECLKLNKGLYGLRQASRIWSKRLTSELNKAGLKVCKTEPGILYWKEGEKMCHVCLHVDDIIVSTNDTNMRTKVERVLKDPFIVKELGKLHQYVGVRTVRTITDQESSITLDQGPYGERSLRRYNFWDNVKKVDNPAPSEKMSKSDIPEKKENKEEWENFPYQSVVGSLMYACTATRPDMMQAVIQLARFMSNWGPIQVKAAKKLLQYWRNTYNDSIKFTKPVDFNGILEIHCFSDSDWAGCPDTRRSTVGFIIIICGGPISWKSRTIKTLALSSCEAEYMALSEIGKEIIWLCHFFTEIGVKYNTPKIFCDASSAINWAEDPIQHKRNKHVELEYYYIRDIVEKKLVEIYKVDTHDNVSDPFTKNIETHKFQKFKPYMMGWKQIHLNRTKAKNPKQKDFIDAKLE
jgi:hypothetical protein